jgi:hypothetical protein
MDNAKFAQIQVFFGAKHSHFRHQRIDKFKYVIRDFRGLKNNDHPCTTASVRVPCEEYYIQAHVAGP